MLLFPQLLSGAVAQFPLKKRFAFSNVTNSQEDGSRYRSDSTSPVDIHWTLLYAHLTASERDALSGFFESTRGRLLPFLFLDPMANLLLWSEDLTNPVWEKSPLAAATAVSQGGLTVTQFGGPSGGLVQASQFFPCPESAMACFSLFARADQPIILNLSLSDAARTFVLTPTWRQYFVAQARASGADGKTAAFALNGGTAEISRLMVAPQPAPGAYQASQTTAGVMPQTRFDQDSLAIEALGENDFSCEVRLLSRLT